MITGAILAGGAASRFDGLPKGLQLVAGERIIDRVARGLRPAVHRLLLVSNDVRAAAWLRDAETVGDVLPGRASAIGIHAALAHAGGDVIVVAWDLPFVPSGLLGELRNRLRRGTTAVIPMGPNGAEPVCAAYGAAAQSHFERLVAAGTVKLSSIVEAMPNVEYIDADEVARFGDPSAMFFNVNRPEDLQRAEAIARAL